MGVSPVTRFNGRLLALVLALGVLVPFGPGAVPATADARKSPELIPFVGSHSVTATWSSGGYHPYPAIDFAMSSGTAVHAAGAGTVGYAIVDNRHCNPNEHPGGVSWCQKNGYADSGTRIRIDHPDGRRSIYLHLSSLRVSTGSRVIAGQLIGYSGNTGISTGPHLHYQENDASGHAADPGVLIGCQGSTTVRYENPQGLLHSTVSNGGYGCIPRSAAAAIWSPGGGVPSLGATVGMHKDGRLQAWGVGMDRRVHTRFQRKPSGPWINWYSWPDVGGLTLRLPVTVAAHKDGRLQVFVASVDGQLRTRVQGRPNGSWGRWAIWTGYAGFPQQTPVAAAAHKDGRLQVFAVGRDRKVHTRLQTRPNGRWGPWTTWAGYRGFPAATPLAVAANKDGRLQVLGVGKDGRVHARLQRGANGGWGPWTTWTGYSKFPLTTPVSAVLNKDGRMQAFAVGAGGRVYTRTQRRAGGGFGAWVAWAGYDAFPRRTLITPAMNRDGRLQVFAVGAGGRVWSRAQAKANGSWGAWSAWGTYDAFVARTPVVVRMRPDGRLQAFAVGGGGRMYTRYQQAPSKGWSEWYAWGAYARFPTGAGA